MVTLYISGFPGISFLVNELWSPRSPPTRNRYTKYVKTRVYEFCFICSLRALAIATVEEICGRLRIEHKGTKSSHWKLPIGNPPATCECALIPRNGGTQHWSRRGRRGRKIRQPTGPFHPKFGAAEWQGKISKYLSCRAFFQVTIRLAFILINLRNVF